MEEAERLCDRVAIIDAGRIVDIGTPRELVARHCPEHTVVLHTDDEPGGRPGCCELAAVDTVTRDGTCHTVRGRGSQLVTSVIHCLAEWRIRVTDFHTVTPTLEDVFLELTGHSVRT